mmetsp:Transcript_1912/g.7133  ORF Transcript_1912/g.7133 Transcript_1912/m.7133 type:complete len:305 (-) Transcript_1912:145-1059(-)
MSRCSRCGSTRDERRQAGTRTDILFKLRERHDKRHVGNARPRVRLIFNPRTRVRGRDSSIALRVRNSVSHVLPSLDLVSVIRIRLGFHVVKEGQKLDVFQTIEHTERGFRRVKIDILIGARARCVKPVGNHQVKISRCRRPGCDCIISVCGAVPTRRSVHARHVPGFFILLPARRVHGSRINHVNTRPQPELFDKTNSNRQPSGYFLHWNAEELRSRRERRAIRVRSRRRRPALVQHVRLRGHAREVRQRPHNLKRRVIRHRERHGRFDERGGASRRRCVGAQARRGWEKVPRRRGCGGALRVV